MKANRIQNEPRTLEDIIFENRNKAYGAYALNKHCTKYLLFAFLISLAGVSTAVALPFLKMMNHPVSSPVPGPDIQVEITKIDVEPVIPPPPPPMPENLTRAARYSVPVVVDELPEGSDIPIMGDIIDKTVNLPVPTEIPYSDTKSKDIVEDPEIVFMPEENATFMNGDLTEFRKWVQSNITYPPKAIDHGIFGKVIVEFCVNSRGQVVDVKIARGVDESLDQETIRVVLSSPLWKAARQGGTPVKQRFVIPVTFLLN